MVFRDKEYKAKQIRRTFEDTTNYQIELIKLVEKKQMENSSLDYKERERFIQIFPRAILSQGDFEIRFENSDGRKSKFRHLSILASSLRKCKSSKVKLYDKQSNSFYIVNIRDLWKFFEYQLETVYPFAREEALHTSAESPAREAPSSYEFSAKEE